MQDARARLGNIGTHILVSQQMLEIVANFIAAPLRQNAGPLPNQAPALRAMHALEQMTAKLDRDAAAQLVSAVLPEFERYAATLGPNGVTALVKIAGRIRGTLLGDAAIARFSALGYWNTDAVRNAIASGESPAYAIGYVNQPDIDRDLVIQSVVDGIDLHRQNTAARISDYAAHSEELNWLIANGGASMTREQLTQAIDDYITAKGGPWQSQREEKSQQILQDGELWLRQLQELRNVPPHLRAPAEIDAQIAEILSDPAATAAIGLALRHNERLATDPDTLDFFATIKLNDGGRKLAQELITAYIKWKILPRRIDSLATSDPAVFVRMKENLQIFRKPNWAGPFGLPQKQVNQVVDALERAMPSAGDDATQIAQKLGALDAELRNLRGPTGLKAFDRNTRAGQLLRGLGLAFAGIAFYSDFRLWRDDRTWKNALKVIIDAAAVSQKGAELALGFGAISDKSLPGRFGGSAKLAGRWGASEFLAGIGAAFDLWSAGEAFAGGDNISGTLYTTGAAGGFMTTFGAGTWAGPVGIGIALASFVAINAHKAHKETTRYETATTQRFLQAAGLSARAAKVLTNQSTRGFSAMPLLSRYAELKGIDLQESAQQQKFIQWMDSLSRLQLEMIVLAAHGALNEIDGDVRQFGMTSPTDNDPYVRRVQSHAAGAVIEVPHIHAESVAAMDRLLQHLSAPPLR